MASHLHFLRGWGFIVYALYNQTRLVAVCLGTIFMMDLTIAALCGWRTVSQLRFDTSCTGHEAPRDMIFFGCVSTNHIATCST